MQSHTFRDGGRKGYVYSGVRVATRFLYRTCSYAPVSGCRNKSRLANTGCYRSLITQSRLVRRHPRHAYLQRKVYSPNSRFFLPRSFLSPCPHYRVSKSHNSRWSGERMDCIKFPLASMISTFQHHYCSIIDIESELQKCQNYVTPSLSERL